MAEMKIDKYLAPRQRQRTTKGEVVFNALAPNRSYWSTWGWNNRLEQVQHFTNWIYCAADTVCSLLGQHMPSMAYVSDLDEKPRGMRRKSQYVYDFRHRLVPSWDSNKVSFNAKGWDGAALVGHHRRATQQYPGWAIYKAITNAQPHEELDPLGSNHPLRRLWVNPNRYDSSYDLTYELTLFLLLCGVSYLWVVPNEYGIPCELWVIPAHWVWPRGSQGQTVDPDYQHLVSWYEVRPFGATGGGYGMVRIPADEVLAFTFKSPLSKIDGWSKLTACSQWIDTSESMDRSAWAQMQNQGMPSMFIELGEAYADADDDQTARIEAKFAQKLGGEYNVGRPFVGKPGMKMTPLNWSPESMMYPTMSDNYRDKVLACFHLSKVAIGMMDDMTYGSILAALAHTWIHCLNPLTAMIGQRLTKELAPRFADPGYRKWLKEGGVWLTEQPHSGNPLFGGQRYERKTGYVRDPSGKRRISSDREQDGGRDIRMWWPDGSPPDPQQVNADISQDFQCILPGQELQGRVIGASKARYAGQAVKIVTRSGTVLFVTPNHPVATPDGFVPAGDLKEGQNVLRHVREVDIPADDYGENAPAKVEEVFNTFSCAFDHCSGEVAAAPVNFHGDAINFKGKVQVVGSYGKLGGSRYPVLKQQVENFDFIGLGLVQGTLGSGGQFSSVPVGKPAATHTGGHGGLVSVGEFAAGKCLGDIGAANFTPTFTAQPCPPALPDGFGVVGSEGGGNTFAHTGACLDQTTGFGIGPDGDFEPNKLAVQPDVTNANGICNLFDGFTGDVACGQSNHVGDGLAFEDYLSFGPAADFDVRLTEGCVKDGCSSTVFAGKLRDTFPGKVALDEVVEVSKFHYDGPVYDFESPVGFIVVNTLLVSNCGAITTNEIRAIRGRAPYELGGDNPLVQGPGGLMPLPLNVEEDTAGLGELVGAFTQAASGGQGGEEGGENAEGSVGGVAGAGRAGDGSGNPAVADAGGADQKPTLEEMTEPEGLRPGIEKPNGKPSKGWQKKVDVGGMSRRLYTAGEKLANHTDPAPMPGYGQIFINDQDDVGQEGQLWYVGGDGDDDGFADVVEDVLREAWPAVGKITIEAESFPPEDRGWRQVYPEKKPWGKSYTRKQQEHPPTAAVDLDGTICEYDTWRGEGHFGKLRDGVREGLQQLRNAGWKIIVFTTRGNTTNIAEFLDTNHVPYDHINKNPDQPDGTSGKVIADVYIDDRAVDARKPWDQIVQETLSRKAKHLASQVRKRRTTVKHNNGRSLPAGR